jgi:hypothetical protein
VAGRRVQGRLAVASRLVHQPRQEPRPVWLEVGKRKFKVRAELLKGEEYEAAYRRVVEDSHQYAGYRKITDRKIPIVRLITS